MNDSSSSMVPCVHCSTAFVPASEGEQFCCSGCEFVHELIEDNGFSRYYDLRRGKIVAPVKSRAFERPDHSWLREKVDEEELKEGQSSCELVLGLQGISCVGCVWLIEKLFSRHAGALEARVDPGRSTVTVSWEKGQCDLAAFFLEVQSYGYAVSPKPEARTSAHRALLPKLGLTGAFAMNAMVFTLPSYLGMEKDFFLAGIFMLVSALSAAFALLVGGSYFISRAWSSLRAGVVHMDMPIAMGILLAMSGSVVGWLMGVDSLLYFDFVAVFVFLMLLGRYFQLASFERNRSRLRQASSANRPVVLAGPEGAEESTCAAEKLEPGARYFLEAGGTVPVASRLIDGEVSVSLESINGEAEPVALGAGQRLVSGARHIGRKRVIVEAEEAWGESLLSKLQESRENGEVGRHPLLEKVLLVYTLTVLFGGLAGGIWWWWATGSFTDGLQVMISLYVVSCPCALGVAIPLVDDMASLEVEKFGVFIRRQNLWSRWHRLKKLIFDKTGTLTLENPVLHNPESLDMLDDEARGVLSLLVISSLHPMSRSLTEALGAEGQRLAAKLAGKNPQAIVEEPGVGLSLVDGQGKRWTLQRGDRAGEGTVFQHDGITLAEFQFNDEPRPGAREELASLKNDGFDIYILSGDREEKVKGMASTLGLEEGNALANQSPEDKASFVRSVDERDTLYVGDGVNDSLAMAEATCTGTPVVDRSAVGGKADFFFLGRSLNFLRVLATTGARRRRAVKLIFGFTLLYNLTAAGFCLAGMMNPLLAAIIMPISSITTVLIGGAVFAGGRGKIGELAPGRADSPVVSENKGNDRRLPALAASDTP